MMNLLGESVIYRQEQLLREIANEAADRTSGKSGPSFLVAIQRRFGFASENGWTLLCHCMDLLGDCEMAIASYKGYNLGGPGYGEKLLRLCGLLTCAYQQGWAILQLCELFKVPKKASITSEFRVLEVVQLRNIGAAHTVTFRDGSTGRLTSFTLSRPHIGVGKVIVFDEQNNMREWNLSSAVDSYVHWAEVTLVDVCSKCIESLFRTSPQQLNAYRGRLDAIRGSLG